MKKVIAAVIALCVTACLLASCQIIRTPIKNVFIVDNAKTYTLVEDVPQSGREKLEVSLARNEKEGCQFILRFDEDVSGVSVKVMRKKSLFSRIAFSRGAALQLKFFPVAAFSL